MLYNLQLLIKSSRFSDEIEINIFLTKMSRKIIHLKFIICSIKYSLSLNLIENLIKVYLTLIEK